MVEKHNIDSKDKFKGKKNDSKNTGVNQNEYFTYQAVGSLCS